MQHYYTPLGGDLSEIAVPLPHTGYYEVLQNPFGFGETNYPNPNRFFAHYTTANYFLAVPHALQFFLSPINSVYVASALAKGLIQLFLIFLFSTFISRQKNPFHLHFLVVALLLSALFQTHGYNRYMGIIDQSVVYSFFYALPLALLAFFYFPFFQHLLYKKTLRFNWLQRILLFLLLVFICLNGPLIPGVILIICPILLLQQCVKNYTASYFTYKSILRAIRKINPELLSFFMIACLLSFYSLYLGGSNSLNQPQQSDLWSRYSKIPSGLFRLLSGKAGYLLLFVVLAANAVFLKRNNTQEGAVILKRYGWVALFSFIYILLLPLGGFREYRPNTIRYDTFIPVTLALFFLFAQSSFFLIFHFQRKQQKYYILFSVIIALLLTNADRLKSDEYYCERKTMKALADADEEIVKLPADCTLMEWNIFTQPEQSVLNAKLFYHWRVTSSEKLYYQSSE